MKGKTIAAFLLGTVVGAGSMYLILNKRFVERLEKRVNEELDKIRGERRTQIIEDNTPVEIPKESPGPSEKPDLSGYYQVLGKTDYNKIPISEPVKTMTETVIEEAKELVETASKKSSKKGKVPKKVTQDEFDSTSPEARRTLYYYADDILADEEDTEYDPIATLGATNFKQFKSNYDTLYVFNYSDGFMYEVIQSNGRYSDIIGEYDE